VLMKNTLDQVVLEIESKILASTTKTDRARKIFDWVQNNITYDMTRRNNIANGTESDEPWHPDDTIARRRGVCTDQTALYAALGRKLLLDVQYAITDIGRPLLHTFAIVKTEKGNLQVDPSGGEFDTHYQEYTLYDAQVLNCERQVAQPPHYYHPRRSSWWKPALIAAGVGAIVALGVYLIPPMLKQRNVKYLETSESVKFITKHGNLEFTLDTPDRVVTHSV